MDQTELKHLSPDEAAEYADMQQLFSSPGWQRVIKAAKEDEEQLRSRVVHAKTWDENRLAYGAWAATGRLLRLEDETEKEFAMYAYARALQARNEDEERFE
jgi:hypothetical protein